MTLFSGHRLPGLAILPAALLTGGIVQADVIGTAELTDTISTFADAEDNSDPVDLYGFETVPGIGTILGVFDVEGEQNGDFALSLLGQSIHEHEATFYLSTPVENATDTAQNVTLDFLISAGQLLTQTFEGYLDLTGAEFLEAGYEITMRFAGATVFESSAILRQFTDIVSNTLEETLTRQGQDLGGDFRPSLPGSSQRARYSWDDYLGTIGLGTLDPLMTEIFEYDVRTWVTGTQFSCSASNCGQTIASIGDPVNFGREGASASRIGALDSFVFTEVTQVPEPSSLALILLGLMGLFALRRSRTAR